jgi:type VI secretion system secreted protein Hcp
VDCRGIDLLASKEEPAMKKSGSRVFLMATMFAVGLVTSTGARAAVDMFLKMSGVVGESRDDRHAGEMDVLAWSWGASTGNARTAKGLIPTACIQDLSVTKWIDSASPQLITNGVTGAVARDAILTVRKAGAHPVEYLVLRMQGVSVAAYQTGGSGGEDRLTENVVLHFDSMRGEYVTMNPDGTTGPPIYFEVRGGVCK